MRPSPLNAVVLLNKMKIFRLPFYFVAIVFTLVNMPFHLSAQTDSLVTDSVEAPKRKLFAAPVVGYSPETRIFFGAGAIYYLPPSKKYPATSPSVVKAIFVYSQNKQIESNIEGDAYFKNNLYRSNYLISFYKFPAYFFGIGNYTIYDEKEKYDFDFFNISLNAQREIKENIYGGVRTFFETSKVYNTLEGGIFETEQIPGEKGGINTGLGLWFTYDTRDRIYFPLKGIFVDVTGVMHNGALGSDYNYFEQTLEISQFNKVMDDDVLAFNFYSELLPGNPPFNRMAKLGGDSYMRGHYEGRYRDKYYLTLQSEYRITFWKYFGINIFGGIGEVADELSSFSLNGLHYSIGAGGRLFIVPEDKLSLRMDVALGSRTDEEHLFGIKNEIGLYITFREAF